MDSNSSLNTKDDEPKLVPCLRGTLPYALYKGKALYSRYESDKLPNDLANNATIKDDTLFLLCSPVLCYGVEVLLTRLKENNSKNCLVLLLELDKTLLDFAQKYYKKIKAKYDIPMHFVSNINECLFYIDSVPFRTLVRLDMSGGVSLDIKTYSEVQYSLESQINLFWKNRIILMKFGRIFAKNIIKNLSIMIGRNSKNMLLPFVTKPIIVCGAGESLITTLEEIKHFHNDFFILCVDAAVSTVLAYNIHIDAVVTVEAQRAILSAFFAQNLDNILVFADLCSCPNIAQITTNISYFVSEYSKANYFLHLKDLGLLPTIIPALGSVGLVAVELALRLRASVDISVCVTGLDFAFSVGATHAKGTPAHKNQLLNTSRLKAIDNINASYKLGAFSTKGIFKITHTDEVLQSYSRQFSAYFQRERNLYDIRVSGLPLLIQRQKLKQIVASNKAISYNVKKLLLEAQPAIVACKIQEWRRQRLDDIKKILSQDSGESLLKLLKDNDYLYLHFPDCFSASLDKDFIKRVKSEAVFFQKYLHFSL